MIYSRGSATEIAHVRLRNRHSIVTTYPFTGTYPKHYQTLDYLYCSYSGTTHSLVIIMTPDYFTLSCIQAQSNKPLKYVWLQC